VKSKQLCNGSPKRRRFSAQQIQQYLADFERGGLSATAFTREHGLCYSVFCRWRKQGRRQPRLQPVALGTLLSPSWAAEIVLPQGVTVRLHAQAAPAWTTQLLTVLCRPC
jgi:transposase-like protein